MKHYTPLLSAVLCLLMLSGVNALAQSAKSVVASGSISATHGDVVLLGTIGQSAIGVAQTSMSTAAIGFWTPVSLKAASLSSQSTTGTAHINLSSRPNPVLKSTTLSFSVPSPNTVSLILYNTLGQPVRTIINEKLDAGPVDRQVELSGLPSGSYTALLRIGNERSSTTLLLVD